MRKSDLSQYMATIGAKGGRASGGRKVRGDAEYYKRIAELSSKARQAKRNADEASAVQQK